MLRKKAISIILSVVCIVIIASTVYILFCPNDVLEYEDYSVVGTLMEQVEHHRCPSLKRLTQYEKDNFIIRTRFDYKLRSTSMSYRMGLYVLNETCPVEYIEKIDDQTVYTIHKFCVDETVLYRYAVYEQLYANENETKEVWTESIVEKTESYDLFEVYYVTETHSRAEFESIQEGSGAEEVFQIDSALSYIHQTSPHRYVNGFTSQHLLTDGLLLIEYERTGEGYELEDYTVTSKTFYPYGTDDPAAQDYKILQAKEPIELP